ncbi:hypothetical protein OC195_06795 [Priestia flexa]|nr:hypothetical protein OC195_06795 [Priestia flexa]
MMQIAAGLAISEDRKDIKNEDIEWIIHSSQLTPRHEPKIPEQEQVGLINGLAVYGPNSGALLEIEVKAIKAKEKGNITITGIVEEENINGQGKSVRRKSMTRSSIENVITVLRSMAVPADEYDIHVNFPGGVPIDGPSAGIAMATGIYSAIYEVPIKHTVAMTGEIGLHGNVKPIGGVIPKIKAAKQAGVTHVIVPKDNMNGMVEQIRGIDILPVTQLADVLKYALLPIQDHVAHLSKEAGVPKREFM